MPDNADNDPKNVQTSAEFRATIAAAFNAGDQRMARIEQQLADQRQAIFDNTTTTQQTASTTAENTRAIKAVHDRTDEMVELFNAMKGGFKVLGWLGQGVKWAAPVIGAIAAAKHAISGGNWWPFH